jgi:hypothetical protein
MSQCDTLFLARSRSTTVLPPHFGVTLKDNGRQNYKQYLCSFNLQKRGSLKYGNTLDLYAMTDGLMFDLVLKQRPENWGQGGLGSRYVGIWSAMGNLCRDLYVMLTFTR